MRPRACCALTRVLCAPARAPQAMTLVDMIHQHVVPSAKKAGFPEKVVGLQADATKIAAAAHAMVRERPSPARERPSSAQAAFSLSPVLLSFGSPITLRFPGHLPY